MHAGLQTPVLLPRAKTQQTGVPFCTTTSQPGRPRLRSPLRGSSRRGARGARHHKPSRSRRVPPCLSCCYVERISGADASPSEASFPSHPGALRASHRAGRQRIPRPIRSFYLLSSSGSTVTSSGSDSPYPRPWPFAVSHIAPRRAVSAVPPGAGADMIPGAADSHGMSIDTRARAPRRDHDALRASCARACMVLLRARGYV